MRVHISCKKFSNQKKAKYIQGTAKRITTESLLLFSLDLVKLFDTSYFFFNIQTDHTAADFLMQTVITVVADVGDKELQLISRSPAVFFQSTADDPYRP